MVEAIREVGGKVSKEVRYFISSIQADAKKFANAVRSHWGIENSLHWVLDVTFNEDQCRVRRDLAAENLALLRKIALNILKADTTTKMSIRKKRKMSVWDDNYMLHLLTQKTETAQNMGI
jgi:predicted transposase YbfD/YdcC